RLSASENKKPKLNMNRTLSGLLKNKPLIWILSASLIFMVNTMLISTVNAYLFKDYFGDTTALSAIGFVQAAATFLAFPLVKPLVARYGKKELASAGMAIAGAVYFLLYFLSGISAIEFVIISALGMFALSFFNLVIWAFVTDV